MERVARAVRAAPGYVDALALREELDLHRSKLATALHRLEDAELVEVRDDGAVRAARGADLGEGLKRATALEEDRERFERSRVEMMRSYAEHDGCRRAFLLGYFGEPFEPPCGACDVCDADPRAAAQRAAADVPFEVGERVEHPEFGDGTVQQVGDGQMTVVFDRVGYKTLATDIVLRRGLLDEAGP
jgi:ATP-dependent DNA helicase RecQ